MNAHRRSARSLQLRDSIWLLSSFCTLHRISFDAALFSQRYPQPISFEELNAPAQELGLQLWQENLPLAAALGRHLPLAIRVGEGDEAKWALILNADESQLAIPRQGDSAPQYFPIAEIQSLYMGVALALLPVIAEAADPDGIQPHAARFGLRWFLPALRKHKHIWREVLTASLVMQFMGLALPLFTQVIIDKVVVHRTHSTLIALGVAMALFVDSRRRCRGYGSISSCTPGGASTRDGSEAGRER